MISGSPTKKSGTNSVSSDEHSTKVIHAYRTDLDRPNFNDELRVQEGAFVEAAVLLTGFYSLSNICRWQLGPPANMTTSA